MMHKLTYGWKQTECRRCGAIRIVGVVCPTCGLIPDVREVDPERQRRQRLAKAALRALAQPEGIPDEMAGWATGEAFPDGLLDGLGNWLGSFFAALGSDLRDPSTEEQLREVIGRLLQYRAVVTAAVQLRPWLSLWRAAELIIESMTMTAHYFLKASSAETPLSAQREAEAGQRAMDQAADVANRLEEQFARWESVSDAQQIQDILPALASEAYRLNGVEDILSLEQAGTAIYREVTGSGECPPGVGFMLQVFAIQAETVLDQERFLNVTRQVYQQLTHDESRLQRLLRQPSLARDLEDGHERAYDAGLAAQAVLAQARHTRQEVREMLSLAHAMLEGPGKRYVAALLAVTRSDQYERLRLQDAGALLQQARQQGLGYLLQGFDDALRNARSHEDFQYDGRVVILTDHGAVEPYSERLSVPALIDRMLSGQETLLAFTAAFLTAAGAQEVDLIGSDFFERLGLSKVEVIEMMLRMLNWTDVQIALHEETLHLRGSVELPDRPLSMVAMMLSFLPSNVGLLAASADTKRGTRRLEGPLEPWRRWQASQDLAKELAFVEAMRVWTIDGQTVWTADQLCKYLAVRAMQEFGAGYPASVRPLRKIRETALRLNENDLGSVLAKVIWLARAIAVGQVEEEQRVEVVEALTAWAELAVPNPFDT